MKRIIVFNSECGVILNAPENEDRFITVQRANKIFEIPFMTKKKLCYSQVYDPELIKHTLIGREICQNVKYHFKGEGIAGVQTNYNCTIQTQPSPEQLEFMQNSQIEYITFEL
jgi:hypothetical protein